MKKFKFTNRRRWCKQGGARGEDLAAKNFSVNAFRSQRKNTVVSRRKKKKRRFLGFFLGGGVLDPPFSEFVDPVCANTFAKQYSINAFFFAPFSYGYADQKEEDSQWDGGGGVRGEFYYSPGSSSDAQQLKTTYPVQREVDEDNEEVKRKEKEKYQ